MIEFLPVIDVDALEVHLARINKRDDLKLWGLIGSLESDLARLKELLAAYAQPEPLVWPPIDLGPVTGTDPDQRYWNG